MLVISQLGTPILHGLPLNKWGGYTSHLLFLGDTNGLHGFHQWGFELNSITDLNNLLPAKLGSHIGFYAGSSAPSNLPSAISSSTRFYIELLSVGQDIIQRVTSRGSNITYERYGTGDGATKTWTAWKDL